MQKIPQSIIFQTHCSNNLIELKPEDFTVFRCDDVDPMNSAGFVNSSLIPESSLNETSDFFDYSKESSIYCFDFAKWTKLSPGFFFAMVFVGYYGINMVVTWKAIRPDAKDNWNKGKKVTSIALYACNILLYRVVLVSLNRQQ